MNNYFKEALFVILIVCLILTPFFFNKKADSVLSSSNLQNQHSDTYPDVTFDTPKVIDDKNYAMLEPFANQLPFDFSGVMQQPFNPNAWMQMMGNTMNYMQMTQLMHQMALMPMQMMNSFMLMSHPHGNLNYGAQTLMSPEEYKKWYEDNKQRSNNNK